MYQKEIIYVELSKNGEGKGNAGFAKVENREGNGKVFLNLKNLPETVNGTYPIRLYDGEEWKEINKVSVKDGGASWRIENIKLGAGIQLQILLSNGYQVYGRSRNAAGEVQSAAAGTAALPSRTATEQLEAAATAAESVAAFPVQTAMTLAATRPAASRQTPPEQAGTADFAQRATEPTEVSGSGRTAVEPMRTSASEQTMTEQRENTPREAGGRPRREMLQKQTQMRPADIKEDKWEQILGTYEVIHPYGDNRTYVKLEPKDFVILQEKYQHLVNNSFLLHGFYNYRYVILGKEGSYYLGVPGVYYERERMVALMFGFEAFECAGGTAREGDFGYYLRKVEL